MADVGFTGRIDAGLENNFGEDGKAYAFHAANDATPESPVLTYTQGNYQGFAMPPFDLSAGIGPTFKLTDKGLRLDTVIGPYWNTTRYQSDAVFGRSIPDELQKNRLTGNEYGLQLRVDVTQDVSIAKAEIPLGGFVQGRAGFLGLNGHGEGGSYYAMVTGHHTSTENYAAPLVGEVGLGGVIGPLSVGVFFDTGANPNFNNLGYNFDQIDSTGATVGSRPATVESLGSEVIPSSLEQVGGNTSLKVSVDLVEVISLLGKSASKNSAWPKKAVGSGSAPAAE